MRFVVKKIADTTAPDRGASMVEYGLIVAFVAMVSLGVIGWVGSATGDSYEEVAVGLGAEVDHSGDEAPVGQDDQNGPGASDDESQGGQSGGEQESPDDTVPPGNGEDTSGGPSDEANQYEEEDVDTGDAGDTGGNDGGDEVTPPVEEPAEEPVEEPAEEPVEETQPTPPTVAAQSAQYSKWEPKKKGNADGEWDAAVTFQNDSKVDQLLTLEVTTVDEKGKKTTSTVEVKIAAGSSSDYAKTGNEVQLRNQGKNFKGVASVEMKLTSITTTDTNGEPVVTKVDQPATVISAPAVP